MNLLALPMSSPEPFLPLFDKVVQTRNIKKVPLDKNWVILFGGGTDVDPIYYGQKPHPCTQMPNVSRDSFEIKVATTYGGFVGGMIGICRGAQLLTITNNGKLLQHIGMGHCGDHPIVVNLPWEREQRVLPASSIHHQMMYPFDLPKTDYDILGWTHEDHLATTYEGETPDERYYDLPVEPDIVWYPKTKSLCLQGHPEFVGKNHPYSILSRQLIANLFQEK